MSVKTPQSFKTIDLRRHCKPKMKKDSRIEKIVVPVVVCILSVSGFILCAYLVFSGITTSWDTSTFLAINDFLPNSPLSVLMIYLSEYGREVVFTSVFFILAFSRKASHRRAAFYMLLTFIALVILGPLVQASLFRVRPYVTLKDVGKFLLPPDQPFEFPLRPFVRSRGTHGRYCGIRCAMRKNSCMF